MNIAKKQSPDNHLKQLQPKIVFFRLGNMTLAEMHVFFERQWNAIIKAIENNFLSVATPDDVIVII